LTLSNPFPRTGTSLDASVTRLSSDCLTRLISNACREFRVKEKHDSCAFEQHYRGSHPHVGMSKRFLDLIDIAVEL